MILQATQLEIEYARDTMPRGVLGMNAAMMEEYLQFIANRRLVQIGLPEQFQGVENPFPWMSKLWIYARRKTSSKRGSSNIRQAEHLPGTKIKADTASARSPERGFGPGKQERMSEKENNLTTIQSAH